MRSRALTSLCVYVEESQGEEGSFPYLTNKVKQAEKALAETRLRVLGTQPALVQPGLTYAEQVHLHAIVTEVVYAHALLDFRN